MVAPPEKLLADLARAFPNPPIDVDTLSLYLSELADVDTEDLSDAVRLLIRTKKTPFRPTIAEIRELVAERALNLPGESAALAQIEARVSWSRQTRHDRVEAPDVHPLVREALDRVGGWYSFRETDNPGVLRGQFLRFYRELRDAAIRETQLGTLALVSRSPYPELPAGDGA